MFVSVSRAAIGLRARQNRRHGVTDYRLVMSLLLQNRSYRDIEAIAGCSHRTIAKAARVCHDHGWTDTTQIDALGAEEIDGLFADGRKRPS